MLTRRNALSEAMRGFADPAPPEANVMPVATPAKGPCIAGCGGNLTVQQIRENTGKTQEQAA
ncbi:MAG: hypothetical protein AAGK28_08790 [Pseudomonadota bacterium]